MAYDFSAQLNLQTNRANLNRVVRDINSAVKDVSVSVDAKNITKTRGQVQALSKDLGKGAKSAKEFGDALVLKGRDLSVYGIAAGAVFRLGRIITDVTREAVKFQFELTKIAQVTRTSNAEIFQQSERIQDISVKYGVAASKIAQITRTIAQTGKSFREAADAADLIARTSLLATFDSLQSTTEGFIAAMSTFDLTVSQAGQSLEAINAVSKEFAVESSDIVEGIRRAGGAFATAGGNINEFIALLTAVRSTSRESAETISTGFRTIFGRLQRPETIEFFRELGVELQNSEGNFIGPFDAIKKLSDLLRTFPEGNVGLAQVIEQIGGIRQISKVVPLLTQTGKASDALSIAANGSAESLEDIEKAQESLVVRIDQLRARFATLFADILKSDGFNRLADLFFRASDAALDLVDALRPLGDMLPLLLGAGASFGISRVARGGGVLGLNSGGTVPGSGNRDTVPALLTPGEFVINKKSVQAIGVANLERANKMSRGGPVQKFQFGGLVGAAGAGVAGGVGLAGLGGLSSIIGLFQSLSTELIAFVANFTLINVQTKLYTQAIDGAVSGVKSLFAGARSLSASFAEARKERRALNQEISSGEERLYDLNKQLMSANQTLSRSTTAAGNRTQNVFNAGSFASSVSGIINQSSNLNTGPVSPDEQVRLNKEVTAKARALVATYDNNADVIKAVGRVFKDLRDSGVKQTRALDAISETLKKTNLIEEQGITKQLENIRAIEEETKAVKERVRELRSRRSRPLVQNRRRQDLSDEERGKQDDRAGKLTLVVNAAAAALSAFADVAAQEAQRLSRNAIRSGDAREAGRTAEEAVRKRQQSSDARSGVSGGFAIGAAVGSIIPGLGTAIGGLIGATVGLAAGFNGVLDTIKGFFGLSSTDFLAEEAKREAATAAAVNSLNNLTRGVIENANSLRRSGDFGESADALISGIDGIVKEVRSSENLSLTNRDLGSDQVQSQLDAFAQNLSETTRALSNAPENVGKSFDEIAQENPEIARSFQLLRSSLTNGDTFVDGFVDSINIAARVAREEAEARQRAIRISLAQINAQREVSETLIQFGSALRTTSEAIELAGIGLGRAAGPATLSSNVSDLSVENIDQEFFNTLAGIGSVNDAFKAQADTAASLASAIQNQVPGIEAALAGFDPARADAPEFIQQFQDISKGVKGLNLGKDIEAQILADIREGRIDASNINQELLNRGVAPLVDSLEKGRQAINEQLQKQAELVGAQIELENKKLGLQLQAVDVIEQSQEAFAALSDSQRSPEQIRQSSLTRANAALQGTRLEGTNAAELALNSGTRGIQQLGGARLQLAQRQRDIRAEQAETADPARLAALNEELSSVTNESDRLKQVMEILSGAISDQSQTALQAAQKQRDSIQALRNAQGDLVNEFAFGSDDQRGDLLQTASATQFAIGQGSLAGLPEELRGAVGSFLERFSDIELPQFGGATGGELRGQLAAQEAVRAGIIRPDQASDFAARASKAEVPLDERVRTLFEQEQAAKLAILKNEQDIVDSFAEAVNKLVANPNAPAVFQEPQNAPQGGQQQVDFQGQNNVVVNVQGLENLVVNEMTRLAYQAIGERFGALAESFGLATSPEEQAQAFRDAGVA